MPSYFTYVTSQFCNLDLYDLFDALGGFIIVIEDTARNYQNQTSLICVDEALKFFFLIKLT